mgnify:CR=1 FL=1
MQNPEVNERKELIDQILSDKAIRRAVTRKSHYWFFSIFLSHYIQYEIALFQQEMFELTEGAEHRLIVVMAFRGSGKSTILNLSYTLWAILGVLQKKFILIVSKTQSQAKNHLQNIRFELTQNELLKQDLGPFESDDSSWGLSSLVLPKMGARITATSREQSVRGIRFGHLRPDLIICDDLEDSMSVQSKPDRDATYNWLTSEVLATGDTHTNVIVLGNLLHEDSLLMRLRADILSQGGNRIFRAYPFSDDSNQVLWSGKYDTKEKAEVFELSIPDEDLWNLEYLLCYVPEKQWTELHKAVREEDRTGKGPNDANPTHILGKYRISTPYKTFNCFKWLHRDWLKRFDALAKTDPVETISDLRSWVHSYHTKARSPWVFYTSLRNRQVLKSIILAALRSGNEKAQREAVQSVQELVALGYTEFNQLLAQSRSGQIRAEGHVPEESLLQESQSRHESGPMPAVEKPGQQDCSQQLGTDEETCPS